MSRKTSGADHTCYQSGHIPNHSTTARQPGLILSQAPRAAYAPRRCSRGSCGLCSSGGLLPHHFRGSPRLGAQPPARRSGTRTGARAERSQRRGRSPAAPPRARPAALPLGAARESPGPDWPVCMPVASRGRAHSRCVDVWQAQSRRIMRIAGEQGAAASPLGSAPCSHCMASFWGRNVAARLANGTLESLLHCRSEGSVLPPIQGTQHPVSIQQKGVPGGRC